MHGRRRYSPAKTRQRVRERAGETIVWWSAVVRHVFVTISVGCSAGAALLALYDMVRALS